MPLPVVADCFRIIAAFTGSTGSKPWTTHFDYRDDNTGLGTLDDLGDVFETQMAAWAANGAGGTTQETRDAYVTDQDIVSYTIYKLDGTTAPEVRVPASTVWGTATPTTGDMPPDVALVASLRTATQGPRGRGRQYWQVRSKDVSANGVPVTWVRTQHGAQLFTFLGGLTGVLTTYSLVVIGRQSPGSGVLVAREVTSISVDAHFDTQRRRGLA